MIFSSTYPVYGSYGSSVSVGGVPSVGSQSNPSSRLIYTRTDISMEEWKALQPQYRYQDFLTAANSVL